MKKIGSILLVLMLLCTMLSTFALPAAAATSGTTGDCTWTLDGTVLTISGNGEMEDYSSYSYSPWGITITEVKIEPGATYIGSYAFYECTELTSVTIPDSVTSIGESAFYGCTGLTEAKYGGVTYKLSEGTLTVSGNGPMCNDYDFIFWKSATHAVIEPGVTSIGNGAFYGCTRLTSVKIPISVTYIGGAAFYGCIRLTSVTIPDSVTSIGGEAFRGCTGLTSVTIPEGVTSIGDWAFYDCNNLKEVAIHAKVANVPSKTFQRCYSIKRLFLPATLNLVYTKTFDNCSIQRVFYGGSQKPIIQHTNGTLNTAKWSFNETGFPEHTYQNVCDKDCDECGITRTVTGHVYDNGCDTTCNTCGDPRSVGSHRYDNACDTTCNECGAPRTVNHTYSNACDTSCNICGAPRVTTHIYTNACDIDCNVCGAVRKAPHVFTYECSVVCAVCLVDCGECGSGRDAEHRYSNACDTTCDSCGEPRTVGPHQYTNACDTSCDICGAPRTISHTYTNACDTACDVCGATREITHSFGEYVYNNDATLEGDGTRTRKCTICGHPETVTAPGTQLKPSNPFKDVKSNQFYYNAVLWAVQKNVTTGTSDTTFSPNDACTRGQIVTFLWRACGSPEPTGTVNPFTDVKSNQYYYKAVLWAVESGITTGTGAGKFSPNAKCTREQIVTFLWRSQGKPAPGGVQNPFVDVKAGAYYYDAVLWAVEKGITTGTSATTFGPKANCTRGQIVTFLYRCLA